ncbi:MAG: DUF4335 domain-containing protein [Gloeomargaritaceae cyanobacterium C42_A2020_066]|nr:DUF4335 domain-containing protein [Gloeomargaritaceae cyanobacterium C42_A2020_066]
MTLQREYRLPHCTLVLEGLSLGTNPSYERPVLSMLTQVDCYLPQFSEPLRGGRPFLEALSQAVSDYAQTWLSGTATAPPADQPVRLESLPNQRHQLVIEPAVLTEPTLNGPLAINLTTVQLFDLVEAFDQLSADHQTLPDWSLPLEPLVDLPKPAWQKQTVPASLGLSTLAAATVALAWIPHPPVRMPKDLEPTPPRTEQPVSESAPAAPPPVTPTPAPTATQSTPPPSPVPSPTVASPPPTTTAVAPTLANAPLSRAQVESLVSKVYDQVDRAWQEKVEQDQDFQVAVDAEGRIVQVTTTTPDSSVQAPGVPLAKLRQTGSQAVLEVRVTLRQGGVLEVSPWNGFPE